MTDLRGSFAVVTGGSSGIGRAIAEELAGRGVEVLVVGRRPEPLNETVATIRAAGGVAEARALDLVDDQARASLVAAVASDRSGLDILVHSAGAIARNQLAVASTDDFDRQYAANVRAPFALTRDLLPSLVRAAGQVVFVNSSAALAPRANAGQFAATQAAMRALADVLRDEVNVDGVRVTSIFPGRTATPRQERLYAEEGRTFEPDRLLQPADIAAIVGAALALPRTAEVTEIVIRSMAKT